MTLSQHFPTSFIRGAAAFKIMASVQAASKSHSFRVILSPALITYLLLKVSGVTLLEKTIVETKPKYKDYIQRTNAFLPWFPRKNIHQGMD
jgi:steroid 5-alpha reductase family enzyme